MLNNEFLIAMKGSDPICKYATAMDVQILEVINQLIFHGKDIPIIIIWPN